MALRPLLTVESPMKALDYKASSVIICFMVKVAANPKRLGWLQPLLCNR